MVDTLFLTGFIVLIIVVPWLLNERSRTRKGRPLWLWLVVALAGIYGSLGTAPHVAAALRERNLLEPLFMAVLLLIVLGIGIYWIRYRVGLPEIGVWLGIGAVYLTMLLRITSIEERSHLKGRNHMSMS